jgi:hypothetical protein
VCARGLVAPNDPLLRHDLHQFEHRGVADRTASASFVERVMDVAYGAGTAAPEHAQNLELCRRRGR